MFSQFSAASGDVFPLSEVRMYSFEELQDITWVHEWADRAAEVHVALEGHTEAAAAFVAGTIRPSAAWPRFVSAASPCAAAGIKSEEAGANERHEAAARDELATALCGHLGCGAVFEAVPKATSHRCCLLPFT